MFPLDYRSPEKLAPLLARLMINVEACAEVYDAQGEKLAEPRPDFIKVPVRVPLAGAKEVPVAVHRPAVGVVYYAPRDLPDLRALLLLLRRELDALGSDHLRAHRPVATSGFLTVHAKPCPPTRGTELWDDQLDADPAECTRLLAYESDAEFRNESIALFTWEFRSITDVPSTKWVTSFPQFNALVAAILVRPRVAGGRLLPLPRGAAQSRLPGGAFLDLPDRYFSPKTEGRQPDAALVELLKTLDNMVLVLVGTELHLVPHVSSQRRRDETDPACWRNRYQRSKWRADTKEHRYVHTKQPADLVSPHHCGLCRGPLRQVAYVSSDASLPGRSLLALCPPCFGCGDPIDRAKAHRFDRGSLALAIPEEYAVFADLLGARVTRVGNRLEVRQANGARYYIERVWRPTRSEVLPYFLDPAAKNIPVVRTVAAIQFLE